MARRMRQRRRAFYLEKSILRRFWSEDEEDEDSIDVLQDYCSEMWYIGWWSMRALILFLYWWVLMLEALSGS